MRNSINLRLFSLFIMRSLIKNRDLFSFFVMGSPLNSEFDVLCEGIGYPYAGTWKNEMFDGMKRNAWMGLDARWYGTDCPVRRDLKGWNVRWYGTECPNGIGCSMVWDGMLCAKKLVARWYGTKCLVRRDLLLVWRDWMLCVKGLGSIFCNCIWKRMGCSMIWNEMLYIKEFDSIFFVFKLR